MSDSKPSQNIPAQVNPTQATPSNAPVTQIVPTTNPTPMMKGLFVGDTTRKK